MNVGATLSQLLKGSPCEPFGSDEKVKVQRPGDLRFYYPDVQVICNAVMDPHGVQDDPVLIVEILSPSTRRIDEHEKREAYLGLASLDRYLLVDQDRPCIVSYRRTATGFEREEFVGLEAVVPLPRLGIELPLREVYARMQFPAP